MHEAVERASTAPSSGRLPQLLFGRREHEPSPLERLQARLDELVNAVAAVVQEVREHQRLAEAEPPALPRAAAPATRVELLFVPSPSGYRLLEQDVEAARGGTVVVDGVAHRVAVVRRSPLLDERRCAYLEPV